jgi:geranylgeranyl reductase family protein
MEWEKRTGRLTAQGNIGQKYDPGMIINQSGKSKQMIFSPDEGADKERMDDINYQVTIVGGGPAGTMAAIKLARSGVKVCLVEKDAHPRYKVCGGGVLARAAKLLPFAIEPVVEQQCHRVEMHFWGKEASFNGQRDKPIIYMVMRSDLDLLLMEEAKRSGVQVFENTQGRDVAQEAGHVTLHTDRETITSRFLIAADGVSSVVAQKGGWPLNHSAIPSMECEVSVDEETLGRFSGTARFDLDHPRNGYSWVFPKKRHLSVGVLSMARDGAGLRESFHAYIDRLAIRTTPPLKLRGAMIPVKPRPGPLVKGRILLAGDAAGLAEPICAEGITNAIRSGVSAAKAIVEGGTDPAWVESIYTGEMRSSVLQELEIAGLHARVMYGNTFLRNMLFRAKGEAFCNRLIDTMMGEADFSSFGSPLRQLFS